MLKNLGWILSLLAASSCGGSSSPGTDAGGGSLADQVKFTLYEIGGTFSGKSTYQQSSSVLITMNEVTGVTTTFGGPKAMVLKAPGSSPYTTSASLAVDVSYPAHSCVYSDSSGGQTCQALANSVSDIGMSVEFELSKWASDAPVTVRLPLVSPIAFTTCKGAKGSPLVPAKPTTTVPLSEFLSGKPFVINFTGTNQSQNDSGDTIYTESWGYNVKIEPPM